MFNVFVLINNKCVYFINMFNKEYVCFNKYFMEETSNMIRNTFAPYFLLYLGR